MFNRFRAATIMSALVLAGCEESSKQSSESNKAGAPKARVGVSRQALQKASDDQLENMLFMCLSNLTRDDSEHEYETVRTWTPGKRMLYTTTVLEMEVNNGGFDQFFLNTRGKASDMALEGLKLVGAERYANLVQRAITVHRQNPAETSGLKPIDAECFKLTEDLRALRVKFIRAHLDEFATPS